MKASWLAEMPSIQRPESELPLTHARLVEVLIYDRETGQFRWRYQRPHCPPAGTRAGSFISLGYRRIIIDKVYYLEHRLAWFYVHEQWPAQFIDHIDKDPANNRIGNLREATPSENSLYRDKNSRNTSGYKGVSQLVNFPTRWEVRFPFPGRKSRNNTYVGLYDSPQKAAAVYDALVKKYLGEFGYLRDEK